MKYRIILKLINTETLLDVLGKIAKIISIISHCQNLILLIAMPRLIQYQFISGKFVFNE